MVFNTRQFLLLFFLNGKLLNGVIEDEFKLGHFQEGVSHQLIQFPRYYYGVLFQVLLGLELLAQSGVIVSALLGVLLLLKRVGRDVVEFGEVGELVRVGQFLVRGLRVGVPDFGLVFDFEIRVVNEYLFEQLAYVVLQLEVDLGGLLNYKEVRLICWSKKMISLWTSSLKLGEVPEMLHLLQVLLELVELVSELETLLQDLLLFELELFLLLLAALLQFGLVLLLSQRRQLLLRLIQLRLIVVQQLLLLFLQRRRQRRIVVLNHRVDFPVQTLNYVPLVVLHQIQFKLFLH